MNKRIAIGLKLAPEMIEQLDAYRAALDIPATRTAVIEKAIRDLLAAGQKGERDRPAPPDLRPDPKPDPKPLPIRDR